MDVDKSATTPHSPVPATITDLKQFTSEIRMEITSEEVECDDTSTQAVSSIEATKADNVNSDTSLNVDVPVEKSDDKDSEASQNDTKMDDSPIEADHKDYKTMNREMKSLINSAKDSKIISEFTQIKTKMRKPRKDLDTSTATLNSSVEEEKLQRSRRNSDNSLVSNSSDVSDKTAQRRSMRSLNPEFVNKQKRFLNSLSGRVRREDADASHGTSDTDSSDDERSRSADRSATILPTALTTPASTEKAKNKEESDSNRLRSDKYCWRCHWMIETPPDVAPPPRCSVCPRSYHPKCLPSSSKGGTDSSSWVCPECITILHAEDSDTRSPAMQKTSLSTLCTLLNYALSQLRLVNGAEEFLKPVDPVACPDYLQHVAHPMDLGRVQRNIEDGVYGSTEAFLADIMWILHNCLVYNAPVHSRLTVAARALVRQCRKELGVIEECPECYAAAHARRPTWFTDVCSTPHILLWAKLKGFPYWPAKGMSVNELGMVDVRFFGDHDRAWVPAKYCYLYSQKDPNNARTQRNDIMESVKEAEQHIKNIARKFGSFVHATPRTPFEPARLGDQLKMMVPGYQGALPAPGIVKESTSTNASPSTKAKRKRSNSKGSKDSVLDGYGTEEEEPVVRRKMPDGEEIALDDDSIVGDKSLREKSLEPTVNVKKTPTSSRKRRRSLLQEASEFSLLESAMRKKRTLSHDTILGNQANADGTSAEMDAGDVIDLEDTATPAATKPLATKDNDEENLKGTNKDKDKPTVATKKDDLVVITRHRKVDEKINPATKKDHKLQTPNKNNTITKTTPEKPKSTTEIIDITTLDSPPKATKELILSVDDVQGAKISTTPEKKDSPFKSADSQLPTITSVCSLSGEAAAAFGAVGGVVASAPAALTVLEPNRHSSIFKASKDTVAMKDASSKLQALRSAPVPKPVSASVPPTPSRMAEVVQVDIEIKAEPIEYEDVDKSTEKNDLLSSLNLRPAWVAATEAEAAPARTADLRSVRRAAARSSAAPRARKTFPQPRRVAPLTDDPRTDLNGKNSMVYIPIQPSTVQPPPRAVAKTSRSTPTVAVSTPHRVTASTVFPTINTVTSTVSSSGAPAVVQTPPPPLVSVVPMSVLSRSPAPPTPTAPAAQTTPVTTQPLVLSSVNGQWTLCLPSMVNVETSPPPMVNGVGERGAPADAAGGARSAALTPLVTTSSASTSTASAVSGAEESATTERCSQQAPPPLRARPGHPLDPATPVGPLPAPSAAGPATLQLNQCAVKLTDYFRHLLSESLQLLEEPAGGAAALRLQLEQAEWRHQQELAELKYNADVQMVEMRSTMERDKAAGVAEARRVAEMELNAAVNHAKSKQWCANCRQEAQFYCCWNTSYCDYPCQQAHWAHHMAVCSQQRGSANSTSSDDSATVTTVGGKTVAAVRAFSGGSAVRAPASPAASAPVSPAASSALAPNVLMSGSNANSGYKIRPHFGQPAYIINKQLMSAEETTTKVTPGGYLIVGAGNTGRPAVMSHSQHSSAL